jgi:hypothetical protein
MPFRIHEILLISSAYDAFILEEDGPLADQMFSEYSELNLSQTPRITHVSSGKKAMRLLRVKHFDFVITVVRIEDTDAGDLSASIKFRFPKLPIALLLFDEADLQHFPMSTVPSTIDRVFLWTGDATILIAAIKLIEDQQNADHDTRISDVRVIIVVEDTLKFYSSFLANLYRELLIQSQSLIAEGLNELHRLVRMRARPKILLATTYEEAVKIYERYQENVMALITDIRFPQRGRTAPNAGIDLVAHVRESNSAIPILMQSSETHRLKDIHKTKLTILDKQSASFLTDVKQFLKRELGFGDFIFRLADGKEVARARNIYEMEEVFKDLPGESLLYHGTRDHFSLWLNARSMFQLARLVGEMKIADFEGIDEARSYLARIFSEARQQDQEGVITDFIPHQTGPQNRFVRLGKGSVGGKGRGIAFMSSMIVSHDLLRCFDGLQIRIPKTVVLGTDEYDRFLKKTDENTDYENLSDAQITAHFLKHKLSSSLVRDLWTAFVVLKGPLAVRSSSILEDSRFFPFAGVYATYMLPNNHSDPMERFDELCRAIVAVYSSSRWSDARRYISNTSHLIEEEKMAVVIQQVVGKSHEQKYYPHFSGVAKSFSYYAVTNQEPEDGVAELAVGLGEMVVSGGSTVRFAPGAPKIQALYSSPRDQYKNSQSDLYALDLARKQVDLSKSPKASLSLVSLADAEKHETLAISTSVYSPEDNVIRDNLSQRGPRVVTFNNILKWDAIPLARALTKVLKVLRKGMGSEIEIEFAVEMGHWGKHTPRGMKRVTPKLYILQVRPMTHPEATSGTLDLGITPSGDILCRTNKALGNGYYSHIKDIVYITSHDVNATQTPQIATQIGLVNEVLRKDNRQCVLIGPGRWGTSDASLGIPTTWRDLSQAKVIIETPMGDLRVEPSQGSHFFHNVVALRIGYLTLGRAQDCSLDLDWLNAQEAQTEYEFVRHVQLEAPLGVFLNGRKGCATVLKSV